VDKVVSFYADDAVVFAPNAPAASTKDAIRAAWKEMLTAPGAALSWEPNKVEVAKSGDLAYITGTYDDTINDAGGKPTKDTGNYVAIFKKQADGNWKIVVDTWNSDLAKK
jgi:ketosteroid isomerase-like protein